MSKSIKRLSWLSFVCALSFLGSKLSAPAALIAYEPFEYGNVGGDLLALGGGSGFSGAWIGGGFNASSFNNYDIAAGGLSFSNLVVSSNHMTTAATSAIAGLRRNFATPLGATGTTNYLSFLIRPEVQPSAFSGLIVGNGSGAELFFGKSGSANQYVMETRGGGGRVSTGVVPVQGQTVFLVLKMEFANGPDRFTLYVNPAPGGAEPVSAFVKSDLDLGTAAALFFYSQGAYSVDEIRLGTSWSEVTPAVAVSRGTIQFKSRNFTFAENDGFAKIIATRTSSSHGEVSVSFKITSGTALKNLDFQETNAVVSWADGELGDRIIRVPLLDDTFYEGSEVAALSLVNPTAGATLGMNSTATLTLLDSLSGPDIFSLKEQPPGSLTLLFHGHPSESYTAFGSTNLGFWQPLGAATHLSNGVFRFVDPMTPPTAKKFYFIQQP